MCLSKSQYTQARYVCAQLDTARYACAQLDNVLGPDCGPEKWYIAKWYIHTWLHSLANCVA